MSFIVPGLCERRVPLNSKGAKLTFFHCLGSFQGFQGFRGFPVKIFCCIKYPGFSPPCIEMASTGRKLFDGTKRPPPFSFLFKVCEKLVTFSSENTKHQCAVHLSLFFIQEGQRAIKRSWRIVIEQRICIGRCGLGIESIPGPSFLFLLQDQMLIRAIVSGLSVFFQIRDQNSKLDEAPISNHSQGAAKHRGDLINHSPFSKMVHICKIVLKCKYIDKSIKYKQQQQQIILHGFFWNPLGLCEMYSII